MAWWGESVEWSLEGFEKGALILGVGVVAGGDGEVVEAGGVVCCGGCRWGCWEKGEKGEKGGYAGAPSRVGDAGEDGRGVGGSRRCEYEGSCGGKGTTLDVGEAGGVGNGRGGCDVVGVIDLGVTDRSSIAGKDEVADWVGE